MIPQRIKQAVIQQLQKGVPSTQTDEIDTNHVWLGQQSDAPTDAEIGTGNVAVYAKTDENIYKRPYNGTETQVGGGDTYRTVSPLGSELQSGFALSIGVPVPASTTLDVISWGVRVSDGTTPTGLLAQLTQIDGTVIAEQNTSFNDSVSASVTNSGSAPVWYRLRIKNETGTDYVDNDVGDPDHVLGNFVYNLS